MKKNLYVLMASMLVAGPALSFPIQSNAEATAATSSDSIPTPANEPVSSTQASQALPSTPPVSSTTATTQASVPTTASSSTTDAPASTTSDSQSTSTTSTTSSTPETRSADLTTWMPDPVLQQIVAKAVGKTVDTLTKEDMPKLTTLYIQNADSAIATLRGLELATNLDSFYMNANSQISDFSLLAALPKLSQVYLMGANVNDQNVPNFGTGITRLNLSGSSVTDNVYDKITKMTGLLSLTFESNMNITTIKPATALPQLNELRVQFCGITDFTPINQMPALTQLAAFGQNTGRNDPATAINAKELNYDAEKQTVYIPFSMMPNRMTNFDGYVPPFSTSNSASQTYLDFNGTQLASSRLAITDEGITVSGVTQDEFDNLQTFEYNARLNNPAGSYKQPERFTFYAISSGTYLHQFTIQHTAVSPGLTVNYVDEDGDEIAPSQTVEGNVGDPYDVTTETYQPEIPGYLLDQDQLPANVVGTLTAEAQTVTYIYQQNKAVLKTHDSKIYVGDPWTAKDNFDGGTDTWGNPITFEDVTFEDNVDPSKVGQYEVKYTYDRVPNRMWTGDYATATATVTVVDRSKEAQPVTIRYVDPDGKEIHKKKELHGTIGEAFDVSDKKYQPAIPNYTLDNKQLPKNAKGLFSDKAQTVTYVYQPVTTPTTTTSDSSSETTPPSTTTDTSTTTETSSSSQSSGKISDSSSSTSGGNGTPAGTSSTPPSNRSTAKQTDKKLPQTNEKITPAYLLAGLAILSFATGLLIVSRKKVN